MHLLLVRSPAGLEKGEEPQSPPPVSPQGRGYRPTQTLPYPALPPRQGGREKCPQSTFNDEHHEERVRVGVNSGGAERNAKVRQTRRCLVAIAMGYPL
jgi:hypothetical protein